MPVPGKMSGKKCITRLDQSISRIDRLPLNDAQKIVLRILAGVLPSAVGSLLLPQWAPACTLLSVVTLYLTMRTQDLEKLSDAQRYWYICMLTNLLLLLWAWMLVRVGHPLQIGRSVGAMAIVVTVAVWPAYVKIKHYRGQRFDIAYAAAGVVVLLQQTLLALETIKG